VRNVGAPTMREADGLAMSSRNQYLEPAERERAPLIHAALQRAVARIAAGDADLAALEREGAESLARAGFRVDYFSVRRAEDLLAPGPGDRDLVVLAAARLGRARLIDNLRASR
jgi:pantoate--beta-alanine ligase